MKINDYKSHKILYKAKYLFSKKVKKIIISVILCIMLFASWQYWNVYQFNLNRKLPINVTLQYEKIISKDLINNNQSLVEAEKFASNNENIYGVLVSLRLAKNYVDRNKLDKAIVQLQQSLSKTTDHNLKTIIKLRLARIQLQQKNVDEALKNLDSIKCDEFSHIVSDIRARALLIKGDKQGACNSWKNGIKNSTYPVLSEIMKMKINDCYN